MSNEPTEQVFSPLCTVRQRGGRINLLWAFCEGETITAHISFNVAQRWIENKPFFSSCDFLIFQGRMRTAEATVLFLNFSVFDWNICLQQMFWLECYVMAEIKHVVWEFLQKPFANPQFFLQYKSFRSTLLQIFLKKGLL